MSILVTINNCNIIRNKQVCLCVSVCLSVDLSSRDEACGEEDEDYIFFKDAGGVVSFLCVFCFHVFLVKTEISHQRL